MTLVTTRAIVLHAFDYSESSRIARLATRDLGVQSVLARGARRPRSTIGRGLDLFTEGIAHVLVRPGRDLQTLTGFDVSAARPGLAMALERFMAASAIAELALGSLHDESHAEAFDVLSQGLDAISEADPSQARATGIATAWHLVSELGFAPTIDRCCVCHGEVEESARVPFSHMGGGVVCSRCATQTQLSRVLPPEARQALRAWLAGATPAVPLSDADGRAHHRLLREFLQHHLAEGRELRAFAAWERGILQSA